MKTYRMELAELRARAQCLADRLSVENTRALSSGHGRQDADPADLAELLDRQDAFHDLLALVFALRRYGADDSRVPSEMLQEWLAALKFECHGAGLESDDEAFDVALDIAMCSDAAVRHDDGEVDLEQSREFAYGLLKAVGRPYGRNLWDGTKVTK